MGGYPGGRVRPFTSIQEEGTMEKRQQQVVEAFQRVRGFVEEHPAQGTQSYTSAVAMLDDVLEKVRSLASMEYRGREVSRAALTSPCNSNAGAWNSSGLS